jgi:acyl dehydratase
MPLRYYDDIAVGERIEYGEVTMTRDEMLTFAEKYDPQPIHTDPEAAAETMYGGIIASGWQTAAVVMRLLVEGALSDMASVGARGVDELRWRRPVYPGDTLSLETEILDKRPSKTHDNRGYVNHGVRGVNGDGETVISWIGLGIIQRRAGN